MLFDKPLEELVEYRPQVAEPADFDVFWQQTLAETRRHPLGVRFEPVDFGLASVDTFDVTFNGYAGQPIKGWFLLPRTRRGPLPVVVEYIGYNGGRGFPFEWLLWSSMGYASFIMDTRGQGSGGSMRGDTPDLAPDGDNPQVSGFMTRGVLSPQTYYYRRVFADACRAVEAARSHAAVDSSRTAVSGGSQGGGITLAVSGLLPDLSAAIPDVPFLCHYRRAVDLTDRMPYQEIVNFCKQQRDRIDQVFTTLSYFDGVNFAKRAHCTALFSTALMDMTCPPSTVFAAYNHYAGAKEIRTYTFNEHEGGQAFQKLEQIKFLKKLWG